MNKYVIGFICFSSALFSCNTKQENNARDKTATQDSIAPLKVTVLADLPDSLQPKTVYVDKMPAPKVVTVGKTTGVTKMLPVSRNEKGQPILDPEGKPMIMGDGGQSNFTKFNIDDGLPVDIIYCSALDKVGNLWFSTYDGLGLMKADVVRKLPAFASAGSQEKSEIIGAELKGSLSEKLFQNFTTEDGLPDNYMGKVIQMPNGKIALGSSSGITPFNVSADYSQLTDIELFNSVTDYPVKNLIGWINPFAMLHNQTLPTPASPTLSSTKYFNPSLPLNQRGRERA